MLMVLVMLVVLKKKNEVGGYAGKVDCLGNFRLLLFSHARLTHSNEIRMNSCPSYHPAC